jgi:hypothetical protein
VTTSFFDPFGLIGMAAQQSIEEGAANAQRAAQAAADQSAYNEAVYQRERAIAERRFGNVIDVEAREITDVPLIGEAME